MNAMQTSELPPCHPPQPKAPYVHRLELSGHCNAGRNSSESSLDLSNLLSDAEALHQLVNDLYRPFEALHVDQIVALQITSNQSSNEEETDKSSVGNQSVAVATEAQETTHRFTYAIGGAIAAAKQLAYGEVKVLGRKDDQVLKKRTRDDTAAVKLNGTSRCKRIVSVECGDTGIKVEWKCKALKKTARVLLVIDWINEVESVFAARDALTRQGCDVVGVSFVVATNANLLRTLKTAQIPFSFSWTPACGVKLSTSVNAGSTTLVSGCSCHHAEGSNGQSPHKRQRTDDTDSDPSVQVHLSHRTAEYHANSPSEDRSQNTVKATDEGVQINAVFDGHGGSRAVEHLRASLCQRILVNISSKQSSDEVSSIIKTAFAECDKELKQSLMVLPPIVRMSKGYCNAGSCAVVALFINSVFYIANVGDCAAVLGKVNQETGGLQAVEVSVDHSCNNPQETRLVVERSHDRNAIRLSKDDQATRAGIFGVKRVAGSLAMTRAFGDFYLKCPELSSAPFKSKVPYITSEPSITTVYMDGSEKYVILASDGLWDVMTPQEAVHIVDKFDSAQSLFFSTASAALIHAALEKIAHRDGLMMHELMAMPQGPVRRRFHDDITCTVVYISHQQAVLKTADHSEQENAPVA